MFLAQLTLYLIPFCHSLEQSFLVFCYCFYCIITGSTLFFLPSIETAALMLKFTETARQYFVFQ